MINRIYVALRLYCKLYEGFSIFTVLNHVKTIDFQGFYCIKNISYKFLSIIL